MQNKLNTIKNEYSFTDECYKKTPHNRLQIKQVNKVYANGVRALTDVNLDIGNGMFGLLGPNGAGKSSLMRSIATLQNVDQGQIVFNGQNVKHKPTTIRQQLGYLPQEFGVYAGFSALELLDYIAVLKGMTDKASRHKQIHALLELTNLIQEKDRAVSHYSGGMRQRFGIAQALLGSPRILVIDEPTAGLDPMERQNLHNLLCELADQMIVILSTHIVEDVNNLCSQMAVMDHGKILFEGTPAEALGSIEHPVWQKSVKRHEWQAISKKHQVLSMRMQGGQFNIRVKSSLMPAAGFHITSADLEDAYFDILSAAKVLEKHDDK